MCKHTQGRYGRWWLTMQGTVMYYLINSSQQLEVSTVVFKYKLELNKIRNRIREVK